MDPRRLTRADRRRRRRRRARLGAGPLSDGAAAAGDSPGCVRVEIPATEVEVVADRLWAAGATAVGERPAGATVVLEAGFATVEAARAAVDAAGIAGAEVVDAGPALAAALHAWTAHARPVRAGPFHVRPVWLAGDDDPPASGEIAVVVDPSRAFGDGSHPSTRACLEVIGRYAGPGVAVLDVGSGSGVLAAAAARLGAAPVVAVDVDPAAVDATRATAAHSGVEVDSRLGSVDAVEGRFDLVVANIGAATAVSLREVLAQRVAPGGRLVVAGLYADRADDLAAGLDSVGLVEEDRLVVDGWSTCIHHLPASSEHTVTPTSRDDVRQT